MTTVVYNRGTNPNQEGGLYLGRLYHTLKKQYGRARTRSVARKARRRKGVPTKRTSSVVQIPSYRKTRSSKSNLVEDTLGEAAQLFAAASQTGALGRKHRGVARKRSTMTKRRLLNETILDMLDDPNKMQLINVESTSGVKARRRRNVGTPKPPPPARGRIIIDPSNNLNRVLKSLGLLTRKDGFEDARHKFTGWFLHGPNAGDPKPGRRSHLTRKAFILAQLAFNAGNKNLPFSLTKLPKRRVKAQALVEAMGPAVRRVRGIRGNIQRGGVIGAAVPAGAIAAAKASAVLAPILKAGGISLLSGAGSVLGAKLTNKLLKQLEEEY